MRILGPIVQPPMATMLDTRHDLLLGCLVAPELVRDDHTRHILTSFEQLAEELLRGCLVPSALYQDIETVPILIDGSPQILRLAADLQEHFIQKPLVARSCASTSELIGVG